jgi:hypothetical protein
MSEEKQQEKEETEWYDKETEEELFMRQLPSIVWEELPERGKYKPNIVKFLTEEPKELEVVYKKGDKPKKRWLWKVEREEEQFNLWASFRLWDVLKTLGKVIRGLKGKTIKIIREGESFDTEYSVEVLSSTE